MRLLSACDYCSATDQWDPREVLQVQTNGVFELSILCTDCSICASIDQFCVQIDQCCIIVCTEIAQIVYRLLNSMGNRPETNVLLGSVAVSFLLLLFADYLGVSTELGCFLAGLAIGSQEHTVVEQVTYIHVTLYV